MTQEEKLSAMAAAIKQLADELVVEGRAKDASTILCAFMELPADSTARLYDILKANVA